MAFFFRSSDCLESNGVRGSYVSIGSSFINSCQETARMTRTLPTTNERGLTYCGTLPATATPTITSKYFSRYKRLIGFYNNFFSSIWISNRSSCTRTKFTPSWNHSSSCMLRSFQCFIIIKKYAMIFFINLYKDSYN